MSIPYHQEKQGSASLLAQCLIELTILVLTAKMFANVSCHDEWRLDELASRPPRLRLRFKHNRRWSTSLFSGKVFQSNMRTFSGAFVSNNYEQLLCSINQVGGCYNSADACTCPACSESGKSLYILQTNVNTS